MNPFFVNILSPSSSFAYFLVHPARLMICSWRKFITFNHPPRYHHHPNTPDSPFSSFFVFEPSLNPIKCFAIRNGENGSPVRSVQCTFRWVNVACHPVRVGSRLGLEAFRRLHDEPKIFTTFCLVPRPCFWWRPQANRQALLHQLSIDRLHGTGQRAKRLKHHVTIDIRAHPVRLQRIYLLLSHALLHLTYSISSAFSDTTNSESRGLFLPRDSRFQCQPKSFLLAFLHPRNTRSVWRKIFRESVASRSRESYEATWTICVHENNYFLISD